MKSKKRILCRSLRVIGVTTSAIALGIPLAWTAPTDLADMPVNGALPTPVNLIFTPSVEYPTATVYAYRNNTYDKTQEYVGYFDPKKCYVYNTSGAYFEASSFAGSNHSCSKSWSGSALNFAMTPSIDPFRWALTGGYRAIDTASTSNSNRGITVLQQAYQNEYSAMSGRSIPDSEQSNKTVMVTMANKGLQVEFRISNKSTTYMARVRVCDDRKGTAYLESNCRAYTNSNGVITYKPVGLIQRYEEKMRYGVFSYLYNQHKIDYMKGGVMRARLKNVGELDWLGNNNPAYEWSPTTGVFVTNPDQADASASGVPNSGVINYINKFGFDSQGYAVYDQPSEMYAEALRYLMNKSPTPAYYSLANQDKFKDGFPVITNWEDPILNQCQANAILGIGDVNTHNENNFGALPFDPVEWTAKMNVPENSTAYPLQNRRWNTGTGGSNMIAGMAYYAHTQNIRPDLVRSPNKMTVDTFWVDVMELGTLYIGANGSGHSNQYWLAAKYGGFKDINNNGVFDPGIDIWQGNGRYFENNKSMPLPDNFFPGSDPQAMVSGLEQAFTRIVALQTTGKGAGLSWQRGPDDVDVYSASYKSGTWAGSLTGGTFDRFDEYTGETLISVLWDANEKISAQNWDTGRKIATGTLQGSNYVPVPFRLANLSNDQKAALGSDTATQQSVLNYLRGNRNGEGTLFRTRDGALGDIVHSKPVVVYPPEADYLDPLNPGYSDFRKDKASRPVTIYIGANDGMLHAIDAATNSASGGQERWAYVPSLLFQGPSSPSTPEINGLQALSQPEYTHHYYVDATPAVADVDFNRTGGPITDDNASSDWRTLLVGGLGKGGKGFFALDVTDPYASTEAAVVSKALWEFAPADMGFSFGYPLIAKTRAWGWVVMMTSGYNNPSGKGILYIVDAKTGVLLQQVETGVGSSDTPSGLTQVEGYTQSYDDFTVDQVYGGDLLGNLWRFDLTDPTGGVTVHKLAELTDASGKPQPVTVAPRIYRPSEDIERRWVFVATGQLLSPKDVVENSWGTQVQTMYAIRDGNRTDPEPNDAATLTRSDLDKVTSLVNGLEDLPEKGWYYDMTGRLFGATERVTSDMSSIGSIISWTGVMPTETSTACEETAMGGTSRIYAVDFENAKTVLRVNSAPAVSLNVDKLVVDTQIVIDKNGDITIITTTTDGGEAKPPGELDEETNILPRVINWRQAN